MQFIKKYLMPNGGNWSLDILSGVTVALALVPEAIAFALVAHVSPLTGLYAAFFMCLITAVLGGRPGMIAGATGATAIVIVSIVTQHNMSYLFATLLLTGLIQIGIGVLRLGKFIRMMPKSVMVGFVNGLAIVIFMAQLEQFRVHVGGGLTIWMHGAALYVMTSLVVLAMAITHYLPKLTTKVPAALTAIVTVTLIVHLFGVDTRSVGDMLLGARVSASFPTFSVPDFVLTWANFKVIVPYAVVLAIVGLSESLMTLSLIDEMTKTRGYGDKECIAQGLGNIVCGFFKAMGGCAMIGQSMINIRSGARGRLSGIIAGTCLLFFILFAWEWIIMIPLAALVGVMFMVVFETFEWATFHFVRKIPLHDAIIIVTVTTVTVATNLAIAVVVGVVMASLVFAWETAKDIHTDESTEKDGTKVYTLRGPLFFGSTQTFKTLFHIHDDPKDVVIDFMYSRVTDHSAIEAIKFIADEYIAAGKNLHLKHLSPECKKLLGRAASLLEVNVMEDPDYHVVTDQRV